MEKILETNAEDESTKNIFGDFAIPTVIKHVKKPIPPFDEVFVMQQNMLGNACNGGPIWFLGLQKNGAFTISNDVNFCGGK